MADRDTTAAISALAIAVHQIAQWAGNAQVTTASDFAFRCACDLQADLVLEDEERARAPTTLRRIRDAPADTFVLLYDPTAAPPTWPSAPWIIGQRGEDGRWFDDEGYPLSPTGWVPLPEVPADG